MNSLATLRSALRPRAALFASAPTPSTSARAAWSTSRSYSTPPTDSSPPSPSSSDPSPASTPSSTPAPDAYKSSKLDKIQAELASSPLPASLQPTWQSTYNKTKSLPFGIAGSQSSRSTETASNQQRWQVAEPISTPAHTTTSSRSFAVTNGDVAMAFRRLNRVLQENNIKKELRRQEYFESPSNKRVRLDSERHRRRFAVAVGRAVSLSRRIQSN